MKLFTPIVLGSLILGSSFALVRADTSAFRIVDDPELDKAVAEARAEFLKKRKYNRLDAVLLLPNPDGSWRRGSFNPEAVAYPASCVKLAYLAAAMRWCRENNHPFEYLDRAVRPMITVSDNVQTGVVVDAITGAPNLPDLTTAGADFDAWVAKRRYTERFLDSRGLLGNQVVLHKTYPSNSGSEPVGAEKLARDKSGANLMQPKLAASLMLEIAKGASEPGATDYMLGLLHHDRWSDYSVLGFGLPPGSLNENKLGVAYDTVEDIQFARLPNGQEFVLSVFTNGRDKTQPFPHDCSHLGYFCELLIDRLDLNRGAPKPVRVDNSGPGFETVGAWTPGPPDVYSFGDSYLLAKGGEGTIGAAWNLSAPETGKYEAMVWYPEGNTYAKDAPFTVYHAGGATTVRVNQQVAGGRWVRLGDFQFNQGEGRIELSNRIGNPNQSVAADAVKIVRWPDALADGGKEAKAGASAAAKDARSSPSESSHKVEKSDKSDKSDRSDLTPQPLAGSSQPASSVAAASGAATVTRVVVSDLGLTGPDPATRRAGVTVLVRDNLNRPVDGAEVAGAFIGDVEETVKGKTGPDGRVRLETAKRVKTQSDGSVHLYILRRICESSRLEIRSRH